MCSNNIKIGILFIMALLSGVAQPKPALAMTLGDIQAFNKNSDGFHAEIPIKLLQGEKIKKVWAATGSQTNYSPSSATKINSTVTGKGLQQLLILSGKIPGKTPFFTLLVQIDLGDRSLYRNFPIYLNGSPQPLHVQKLTDTVARQTTDAVAATATSTETESPGFYGLWWIIGATVAAALFWVWWSQGPRNDEELLAMVKGNPSELSAEDFQPIFSDEEEDDPKKPHEPPQHTHENSAFAGLAADGFEPALEKPDTTAAEESAKSSPEIIAKPPPTPGKRPPATVSQGRLSPKLTSKPESTVDSSNQSDSEALESGDMSFELVMNSLGQILDKEDESKYNKPRR